MTAGHPKKIKLTKKENAEMLERIKSLNRIVEALQKPRTPEEEKAYRKIKTQKKKPEPKVKYTSTPLEDLFND